LKPEQGKAESSEFLLVSDDLQEGAAELAEKSPCKSKAYHIAGQTDKGLMRDKDMWCLHNQLDASLLMSRQKSKANGWLLARSLLLEEAGDLYKPISRAFGPTSSTALVFV
jgi:hypothetical protein